MGIAQYLVGLVVGLVCVVPIVAGARRLRVRLVPSWTGTPAWVADGVVVAALVVLTLETAGILGLLTRAGAAAGCVMAGGLAAAVAPRIGARRADLRPVPSDRAALASEARDHRSPATPIAVAAFALVAAPWLGWTVFAYRHGMETVDTLWYHLPFAARFVQLGNILHLHYFDSDPVTVFYPANSELFHALGLLLFRSDLASPAINLGWAALALVAAWAIGKPFRRGPHCLIAVLLVLGTPGLVDTQPGGAYNDVTCVALLLASAALLINGRALAPGGPAQLGGVPLEVTALAAVAAGLALGTKLTMIAPALALGIGTVIIAAGGTRVRQAGVWAAGLLALGGFWYLRNWIVVGNPVPSIAVHLGPLLLPAPHVSTPTYTVGHYLTDLHVWKLIFIPGLRQSLGLAWWALIAGAVAGCAAAVLSRGDRVVRMLGAVGGLAGVAFLVTPQFLGLPNLPIFFNANVRYGATPLALGLVLMPILPTFRTHRRDGAWLAAACIVLLFTELDPGVWPTGIAVKPFATPIRDAPAVAGALLGFLILVIAELHLWCDSRMRLRLRALTAAPRPLPGAATTIAVLAVGAGGWFVADSYARRRYADTSPLPSIYAWAQGVRNARIGLVGNDLQYPLYGADDSNYVQYLGAPARYGGYGSITSCRLWRREVNRGHYDWVLVTPFGFPLGTAAAVAPEVRWTATSSQARPTIRETTQQGELAVLYRITGTLSPSACPGAS